MCVCVCVCVCVCKSWGSGLRSKSQAAIALEFANDLFFPLRLKLRLNWIRFFGIVDWIDLFLEQD